MSDQLQTIDAPLTGEILPPSTLPVPAVVDPKQALMIEIAEHVRQADQKTVEVVRIVKEANDLATEAEKLKEEAAEHRRQAGFGLVRLKTL
jgi:hypothetical protein